MPSSNEIKRQNELLAQQQDIMSGVQGAINGATASANNLSRALQGAVSYASEIDADMIAVARATNEASGHANELGHNLTKAANSGISAMDRFGSSMGKSMSNAASTAYDTVTQSMGAIGDISRKLMSFQIIGGFSALFALIASQFEKTSLEIRDELGIIFTSPEVRNNVNEMFAGMESSILSSGLSFKEVLSTAGLLTNEFGLAVSQSGELGFNITDGAKAIGIQASSMASIVGSFQLAYDLSADQAHELSEQTALLAAQNDVAPVAVMQDIASSTEDMAQFSAGGVKNFIKAAIQARKLGMNIKDVANTMNGLLNFEDSLNKELQASIMLGKRINLNEARRAAFAGDAAGALEAVAEQLGDVDLENLDPLTLQSVAQAANLSTSQLMKLSKGAGKLGDVGEDAMGGFDTSVLNAKDAMGEMQQITAEITTELRKLGSKHGQQFFDTIRRTFDMLMDTNFLENTANFLSKFMTFMDELMSKPFMKDGKLLSFDEEGNAETKLAVLKKGAGDMARQLANVVLGLFGFDGDVKDLFDGVKKYFTQIDTGSEMIEMSWLEGIWYRVKELFGKLGDVELGEGSTVGGIFGGIFTSIKEALIGEDGLLSKLKPDLSGAVTGFFADLVKPGEGGGKSLIEKMTDTLFPDGFKLFSLDSMLDPVEIEKIKKEVSNPESKLGKAFASIKDLVGQIFTPKLTEEKIKGMFKEVDFEKMTNEIKSLEEGTAKAAEKAADGFGAGFGLGKYIRALLGFDEKAIMKDLEDALSKISLVELLGGIKGKDTVASALTTQFENMSKPGGAFEKLGQGMAAAVTKAFNDMKLSLNILKALVPGGEKGLSIKMRDPDDSKKFITLEEYQAKMANKPVDNQDFISRPGQGIESFSPQDTIIGAKGPIVDMTETNRLLRENNQLLNRLVGDGIGVYKA